MSFLVEVCQLAGAYYVPYFLLNDRSTRETSQIAVARRYSDYPTALALRLAVAFVFLKA
jgi:hypothetical protein